MKKIILLLILVVLFFYLNFEKHINLNIFKNLIILFKDKGILEMLLSLIAIFISIIVYKNNKKNEEIKVMPMFEIYCSKDDISSADRLNGFNFIQINEKSITITPSKLNHGYYRQEIKIKLENKGSGTSFNTTLKKLSINFLSKSLAFRGGDIDLILGKPKIIKIINQKEFIYIHLSISAKDYEYEKLKDFSINDIKNYAKGIQANILGKFEFQDIYLNTYLQEFELKNVNFILWDEELTHYQLEYNLPPIRL